jgi:hypothetical protein
MPETTTHDSLSAIDWVPISSRPKARLLFYAAFVFLVLACLLLLVFRNVYDEIRNLIILVLPLTIATTVALVKWLAPEPELFVPRSVKIQSGASFSVRWRRPARLARGNLSCYFLGEKVSLLSSPKTAIESRREFLRQPIFTASAEQNEGVARFEGSFRPELLVPSDGNLRYSVQVKNDKGFPRKWEYDIRELLGS